MMKRTPKLTFRKSRAQFPPIPRPPGTDPKAIVPGYHLLAEERFDFRAIHKARLKRERQPGHWKRRRFVDQYRRSYLLAQVGRLSLAEFMPSEIARELGISKTLVFKLQDEALEQFRLSAVTDYNLSKEAELRRISFIWQAAFVAWEESCKTKTSTTKKYTPADVEGIKKDVLDAAEAAGINTSYNVCDKGGTKNRIAMAAKCRQLANLVASEVSVKREKQTGNPAYLTVMQWCVEMRCKIMGLMAPQQITLDGEFRVAGGTAEQSEQEMLKMFVDRVRTLQQPKPN